MVLWNVGNYWSNDCAARLLCKLQTWSFSSYSWCHVMHLLRFHQWMFVSLKRNCVVSGIGPQFIDCCLETEINVRFDILTVVLL
jgi:hypothetical protein